MGNCQADLSPLHRIYLHCTITVQRAKTHQYLLWTVIVIQEQSVTIQLVFVFSFHGFFHSSSVVEVYECNPTESIRLILSAVVGYTLYVGPTLVNIIEQLNDTSTATNISS